MKKKGVSLIVLGLTIIVLAILSGAVLLVSAPSNPVKEAREKTYKTDLDSLSERLAEKIGNLEQSQGIDGESIYLYGEEADNYIPGLPEVYKGKIGIEAGRLVVLRDYSNGEQIEDDKSEWTVDAGYKVIPAYYNPPIPEGYTASSDISEWNSGFTIKDSYNNEFVWVPAMSLKSEYMNGKQYISADDAEYNKCFGTRDYTNVSELMKKFNLSYGVDKLEIDDSNSKVTGNSVRGYNEIVEDVELNGGFYISKYEMAKNSKSEKYTSNLPDVPDRMGTSVAFHKNYFASLHPNVDFTVMTASHYDTLLAWILSSGAKTKDQVEISSRGIGNYYYDAISYKNSDDSQSFIKPKNEATYISRGGSEKTYINGIADLAGNMYEVAQGDIVGVNTPFSLVARGSSVTEKSTAKMTLANIDITNASASQYATRTVLVFKH